MVAIAFSPRRFTVTKHCGNKGERSCLRRSRPSVAQFNGDRWQATEKATLPLLEGPSEPKVVCRDFTHTGYDAAGRRTQLIDPLNRRTTSAYDSAGRQTLRLDPRGFKTTYVYDALDRVTSRRYPNGTRATFVFDAVGNRTGMRDATGRCTSTYDTLNRLSQYRTPFAKVLTYVYDDVSNRSRLWESSAGRYTYAYDENNRLTRIINTGSVRTTFVYNGAGQRTVLRQGNGTRTSYSYDAAGQTTQIFHRRSNATSLLQLDYRYDTAGNRHVMVEGAGTARVTWLYDDQNQLTGENRTGANAYRNTFTFDAAGNRTLKNAGGTRTTYSYDVANQLTYALAAAGRTTYTFDAAGNQRVELTPAGVRTTTSWNYENQPSVYQLTTGSRVTMSYNADNRRTQKQTAATVSTKFIWEPTTDAYFSELNNSNTNQKLYTFEPVQYGNLISQRVGGDHYIHADSLGSTRALSTNGTTVSDTFMYDAWGTDVARTGTTAIVPFRWVGGPGYYYDTETQLFYVRARMFQPILVRWVSIDPDFEFPKSWSYSYCENNPAVQRDPDGTKPFDEIPPLPPDLQKILDDHDIKVIGLDGSFKIPEDALDRLRILTEIVPKCGSACGKGRIAFAFEITGKRLSIINPICRIVGPVVSKYIEEANNSIAQVMNNENAIDKSCTYYGLNSACPCCQKIEPVNYSQRIQLDIDISFKRAFGLVNCNWRLSLASQLQITGNFGNCDVFKE